MENKQKSIVNFLSRQIAMDKVSHAYLLVGKDADALAIHLSKMLLCESNDNKPCGHCGACQRIDNKTHADFQWVSGKEVSIKKDDVLDLKHEFVQTSLESSQRQVYVIDNVDNATAQAMNSLLKYLEEPEGVTTAFLTTDNENRVLETIKSRCMILSLEPSSHKELYSLLMSESYDELDAFYLSHLCQSLEEAQVLSDFNSMKDMAHEFMGHLRRSNVVDAILFLQLEGTKNKKFHRDTFNLFLSILEILLSSRSKDSLALSKSLENFENRNALLESVISIHDRLRPGVNIGLLVDQLVYEVMKIDKTRKF